MAASDALWDAVEAQARLAYHAGEVPVGALIVRDGEILCATHNRMETLRDATAHAEMLAIREAQALLGEKSLAGCDLYVSLEPCAMCAGAIAHSRISRLYFGAYDPKGGAVAHGAALFAQPTCLHKPQWYGGIRESSFVNLLQQFFQERRV